MRSSPNETREGAQHERNRWRELHAKVSYRSHDSGAGLVKRRINACRAKLVLLERQAASNTQSRTPQVCTDIPWSS